MLANAQNIVVLKIAPDFGSEKTIDAQLWVGKGFCGACNEETPLVNNDVLNQKLCLYLCKVDNVKSCSEMPC